MRGVVIEFGDGGKIVVGRVECEYGDMMYWNGGRMLGGWIREWIEWLRVGR